MFSNQLLSVVPCTAWRLDMDVDSSMLTVLVTTPPLPRLIRGNQLFNFVLTMHGSALQREHCFVHLNRNQRVHAFRSPMSRLYSHPEAWSFDGWGVGGA